MTAWIALFVMLLLLSGFAVWRQPKAGALVSLIALYVFYQVSSVFFLVPRSLYKDGGNGTVADWPVWLAWSVICVSILLLATGFKRLTQRR
jgi:hypothetical protein